MINFEIGGYYFKNGERVQLIPIEMPTITDLNNYLDILKINNGKLILRNDLEDEFMPYEMVLYSDNHETLIHIYMILFATDMEDGDIEVRTFNDESGSKEFIPMLGEPFAIASTTKNFSLVIQAFKEFLETGDVSRDLLS
ncbi:MAG: hypothetical protein J6578_04220 [Snodgrassella sp.]|uniref:DUF6911 family protein n=1 Tax=Snodgrassella TaxID=1193515 RepID=UPI0025888819|nr:MULTISPECIES: hypothetical protein [Snodgrassella]MCO6507983.1 hypothetical protein [Snodgrassella sp.]MCO6555565.1 hypothetical protein [Gilliamella sp.]WMY92739.1 hypothetical protein PYG29_05150 [Snodgrassella communis]